MPTRIFLLGPDHWDDGVKLPWPAWAIGPKTGAFTPKRLREEIALQVANETEDLVRGHVMDSRDKKTPDEDDAVTFHNIEKRLGIDAYFIIVPDRTKVLGTVFEGGMLVRDKLMGRDPYVAVFMEKTFANANDEGEYEFAKGKRTQYLRSVLRIASHVDTWNSLEEAVDQVVGRALE